MNDKKDAYGQLAESAGYIDFGLESDRVPYIEGLVGESLAEPDVEVEPIQDSEPIQEVEPPQADEPIQDSEPIQEVELAFTDGETGQITIDLANLSTVEKKTEIFQTAGYNTVIEQNEVAPSLAEGGEIPAETLVDVGVDEPFVAAEYPVDGVAVPPAVEEETIVDEQVDYQEQGAQAVTKTVTSDDIITDENAEPQLSAEERREQIRRKYMVLNDGNLNVAKIMVIGVGGAGNNAVNRMIQSGVNTARFVAINTDKQALMLSECAPEDRYQIGANETKGLGAGADPEIGEKAANESKELIEEIVKDVDLVFIAAGMGGGTGTGAAPVIAKIAKEKGCVTVAVVTKPFSFEGARRGKNAEKGIANLQKHVDTIIIIPNDKLMEAMKPNTPILEALRFADDTLRQGICGIADLIATPSLINLDFADVRTTLKNQGLAHMGIGMARGENRILEAVKNAVSSPLLETTIEGAKSIILNVTGGNDLTLMQVNEAANSIKDVVDPDANVIFGMNINPDLSEEVIITLIATGFDRAHGDVTEENVKAYNGLFANMGGAAAAGQPVGVEEEQPAQPAPATGEYNGFSPDRGYTVPQQPEKPAYGQPYQPAAPYQPAQQPAEPYQPRVANPSYVQPSEPPRPAAPETEEPTEDKQKISLPSFVKRLFGKK